MTLASEDVGDERYQVQYSARARITCFAFRFFFRVDFLYIFSENPPPFGPASDDLNGTGIRYFMIKSWNAENVMVAQREGIWSTQLKNEQMLTDAFHSSRHVILLFSVNKSMAFQGYVCPLFLPFFGAGIAARCS